MKPRSLLFTLFGDYVIYTGEEVSLRALASLAGWFGISEESLRVTLSRMAREGWLQARRQGRASYYRLTPRTRAMLAEGRERIFARGAEHWTGEWCLVTYALSERDRALRDRLRRDLGWLGFGQLPSAATWLGVGARFTAAAELLLRHDLGERAHLFRAHSRGPAEDRALVAQCWDLEGLNRRYQEFVEEFRPALARAEQSHWDERACFVERVRMVDAYRKFPFLDPDLPAALLPSDWAGHTAHQVFTQGYHGLAGPAFAAYQHTARPAALRLAA